MKLQAAYQPSVALQIFQEFSQKETLFYVLDKHEHRPPARQDRDNGGQGRSKRGGWVTFTALGNVIVAML